MLNFCRFFVTLISHRLFGISILKISLVLAASLSQNTKSQADAITPRYYFNTLAFASGNMKLDDVTQKYYTAGESDMNASATIRKGDFTLEIRQPSSQASIELNAKPSYVLKVKGDDRNLLDNFDSQSMKLFEFSSVGKMLGWDYYGINGSGTNSPFLYDPFTGKKSYFPNDFSPASINRNGVIVGQFEGQAAIMQSFDSKPELLLPLMRDSQFLRSLMVNDIDDFGMIIGRVDNLQYGNNKLESIRIYPIEPIPVPEPSTWIVIAAGSLWILRHRRG